MKRTLAITAVTLGLALSASATLLFQVDELGNGSYSGLTPSGWSGSLSYATFLSPAVGPQTLSYDIRGDTGLTPVQGDVWLREPGQTMYSDLLRFSGGRVFFYSDNSDGADGLADVGIPPAWPGAATITLIENGPEGQNGYWGYQPTVGQPGYIANTFGSGPASYNFISDVPEPTTMIAGALLLLPFGASTLRMLRSRTA